MGEIRFPVGPIKSRVLLVEGPDDEHLLREILAVEGMLDLFWVVSYGGKDNLASGIETVLTRPEVTSLAVFRDADNNASNAFASVVGTLKKFKLPIPSQVGHVAEGTPKIAVFIFPDGKNKGAVETLCLQSEEGSPLEQCIDAYVNCLKAKNLLPKAPWVDKVKLHSLIAAKAPGTIFRGENVRKVLSLNHSCFASLKTFLHAL